MSGGQERELLGGLLEGLEAHGVTVTPEMRETLAERLASGLASATRVARGRRKDGESQPEHARGYLDLWRGVLSSAEGAAVIERVGRWPERERVIANGLCLAELSGSSAMSICDIAVLWPDWYRVAERPSDLKTLWYPACWQISKVLRRFGYEVKRVGEDDWDLLPIDDTHTGVILSAKAAANDICAARAALLSKDYEAASRHALDAINRCPVATAAHWLVAELSRSKLVKIDQARQLQSADALLDRKRSVQAALDRLKMMRGNGRRTMRHDWVAERVGRFAEELVATAPLIDWAQKTIDAAVNDQEGE